MNEDTFLAALHESPNDKVTWSALADWLEEDGQTQRAELVRIVRHLRTLPVMKRTKQRIALEERLAALLLAGVRPVVPEVVNSIGMRFALIPPGRFRMGSPRGETGRGGNEPARMVEITRLFYLGVFEVTQRQYQTLMGENPSFFSRGGGGEESVQQIADEDLLDFPVEQVSWSQAQQFLRRMTNLKEEQRAGRIYRLPTEAEWEYACRADTSTPYYLGKEITTELANFGGVFNRTCKVGSYRPNAWGLYDMHGNLWEWCSDWYSDYVAGPLRDPEGLPGDGRRVNRGGCWHNSAKLLRAADRNGSDPSLESVGLGMRAAFTLAE
jgi:uncharacterized protein (TIGR02996 family)